MFQFIQKERFRRCRWFFLTLSLLGGIAPANAQSTANTSYWTGQGLDGQWNTLANWNFGPDNLPATALPQSQLSSSNRNVLFDNGGSPTATEIQLSSATSLGSSAGSADMIIREGDFVFDLNGNNLTFATLYLGHSGSNGMASFENSSATAGTVQIRQGITLGGSGMTFDLNDFMDQAFAGNVNASISNSRNLTVGHASGGINNTWLVGTGQNTTWNGHAVIESGSSSGSSNNRIEVNGGTLNLSNSASKIDIKGNGSVTATADGGAFDNQVLVRNGGVVNVSLSSSPSSTSDGLSVGSGSEMRIIESSELNFVPITVGNGNLNMTIADKGLLLLDDSKLTNEQGNPVGGVFSVAGQAVIRNDSEMSMIGQVNVASTGELSIDASSFSQAKRFTSFNQSSATIAGLLSVTNGGSFEGIYTSSSISNDYAAYSLFRVTDGGRVRVDGDSSFAANSILQVEQGGALEVKGNSSAEVATLALYYSVTVNGFESGDLLVEQGSTLYFDTLTLANEDFMESKNFGEDATNVLDGGGAGGLLIWGSGGAGIATFNGNQKANLRVESGTRLRLQGATGMEYSLNNGRFTISNGASLEGSGVLSESTLIINEGIINPGINNGAQGEAGQLTFKFDGGDLYRPSGNIHMDVYGLEDYDQILLTGYNDTALTVNLWDRGDGGLDFLFAGTGFDLFRNLNGEDISSTANVSFDFSQSALVLADLGLAWNTSEFATRGVLTVQEVARLVYTNAADEARAPGSTLGDGDVLKVTNALHAIRSEGELIEIGDGVDAKIVSKEVSNAGFEVDGLEGGTELANPNNPVGENSASGEVSFINNNALNGTHTATLSLQMDVDANSNHLHDQVTQTWNLSHTVSGRVADSGIAYIDAGRSYANFSLMSTRGTEAEVLAGMASTSTTLQMNLSASGPSLPPGLLSDVLTLDGTGSDEYVLSMTYDVELYGEIGGEETPMLAWYDMGLNDWVNAVLGNVGDSTPTYYEGAWSEDYGLGSYGWDELTNSVWAVLDHNSEFAVVVNIVPEPGRAMLLLLGLTTLLFRRRRKPCAC